MFVGFLLIGIVLLTIYCVSKSSDNTRLYKETNDLKVRLKSTISELEYATDRLAQLSAKLTETDREIQALQTMLDKFEAQMDPLQRGCLQEDKLYAEMRAELSKCKLEYSRLFTETEELKDRLSRQINDAAELKDSGFSHALLTTDYFHSKYMDLDKAIKQLQGQYRIAQDELAKAVKMLERHSDDLDKLFSSPLTAMPWLAGMMADFLTYDLEVEAKKLDWGNDIRREKKVASIREIRADARDRIAAAKEATYQLDYLLILYPSLEDVLSTDYKELDFTGKIPEYDPARDFLSKDEWQKLTEDERNQLALDRYVQSTQKSKWQIGRDYELAVAYEYQRKGYKVVTFGSYMGVEDMGRDLIAIKEDTVLIIQCKYWSQHKTIHEKHIFQLYGTTVSYCLENHLSPDSVHGIFVTNTGLSDMARAVASYLNIAVSEHHKMTDFPRIKCNIGQDENGIETHIYHLPMDAQYDVVQISKPGECYAFTVKEAVARGFRRAYRWHGT